MLVLHFFFFTLPHFIRSRLSPTRRRRMESNKRFVRPPASRSGGVLVLTLVLLALLTALLLQAQALARGRLRAEESADQASLLRRAATDSIYAALQRLADDPDLAVDSTNEAWAVREQATSPQGVSTLVVVRDGSSRFDLNNLAVNAPGHIRNSGDILMDVLTLCGDFTPSARVNALTDFMDADEAGLYEKDFCAKDMNTVCPNHPLYSWGSLLAASGWTKAAFARKPRTGLPRAFEADLADLLTLNPAPRKKIQPININTASRETLTAVLGLGQDTLVASILSLRAIKPIRDVEMLAVMAEPGFFETVRPYLAVRSSFFDLQAQAYAGGRSAQIRALASRDLNGKVDVVQWLF